MGYSITKVHENRLRRMADRQGLRLEKLRARDIFSERYGAYRLVDIRTSGIVLGWGDSPVSAAEIEAFLLGDRVRIELGGVRGNGEPHTFDTDTRPILTWCANYFGRHGGGAWLCYYLRPDHTVTEDPVVVGGRLDDIPHTIEAALTAEQDDEAAPSP